MLYIVVRLIDMAISLYIIVLIARVFLPLVGADPYNPIYQFIFRITEPLLAPLRRWTIVGNLDLSPLVVMVGLMILRQILFTFLYTVL
jgi:YggT family protein